MKIIIAFALVLASVAVASAQYRSPYGAGLSGTGSNFNNHPVDSYTNNNGTYVAPHYQTNPNHTQFDNYGTRGNVNPYTGQVGTRAPRW